MIVQVARAGRPRCRLRRAGADQGPGPADPEIEVVLTTIPRCSAIGRVREVAPRADPVTGTFEVKVGLDRSARRDAARIDGDRAHGGRRCEPGIEMPASALTRAERQPAVWVVDPATETVSLRNIEVLRHDPTRVHRRAGPRDRRHRRDRGRPGAAARASRSACWARRNDRPQPLGVGGPAPLADRLLHDRRRRSPAACPSSASAATRIRPSPSAPWWCRRPGPGATLEDTVLQVTERIERKIQEVAGPRLPDQLHPSRRSPRSSSICAATRRRGRAGPLVRRPQEGRRHPRAPCRAASSAPASTTSSATSSASSTASPPTASPIATCATSSRPRARACCWSPTSRRSRSSAPRTSRSSSSSRPSAWPRSASTTRRWSQRSRRRTRCGPAGVLQTGEERLSLRVSGAFDSELDILDVNFVGRRPHRPPRRHRRGPPRLCRPAAADVPRQRRARHRARHRDARRRRHPGARPQHRPGDGADPGGAAGRHRADPGRRPGGHGRPRDQRVHHLAVAGDPDHHRRELRQPRRAPGHGGGAVDPADARDRLPDHGVRSTSTCSASRSAR